MSVFDRECDGHWVSVRYRLSNGVFGALRDGNGCAGTGANRWVTPYKVVRFQVCEEGTGCAPIRDA